MPTLALCCIRLSRSLYYVCQANTHKEVDMAMHYFVRSVPLLVGVEADNEGEAWKLAGQRVDDFMSDAMESVERYAHDGSDTKYVLEYQGDAIYARHIPRS